MIANAALSLALCAALPQNDAWPHYRGPDRSGRITSQRTWTATGKQAPLWRAKVGKGYSSPSIADGKLVTLGYDETNGVDRVLCLDAITGKELWRYEFAATDKPQYHGGGTLSTPTIAAGLVYCLNRDGLFHVLNLADGKLRWSKDYQKATGVNRTFHGFSSAPIVEGDRFYIQLGGLALAAAIEDGAIAWQSKDHGDISHANLLPIQVNGTPALATVLGTTFVALDRATGKTLQEYPWPLRGNAMHCAIPLTLGNNRVFLSTAYNKGCALLEFGDSAEPSLVWANRRMRNKVTASVAHQGHLYGFDESMLRCLDQNGQSQWRVRGLGLGSLSIVDDRLLVLTADGELIVAAASPSEFRELSRHKVLDGGVYWTAPVFVDGLIYVRNSLGDLCCLDHRSDSTAPPVQAKTTAPAPAAGDLFAHNAELAGSRASLTRPGKCLRIKGKWSIPLRGLKNGDMTWLLLDGGAWDQRLDAEFFYAFDGTESWTIEPQGPRIITGDELFEHRHLFDLPAMLAPECPADAKTRAAPVTFAETRCWCVSSSVPTKDGRTRKLKHYFATTDGRLVGREGENESTLAFHGTQERAGVRLPVRITRYRAEDGQEHVMTITSAEWITPPEDVFKRPVAILRLSRTKAEIARDSRALRQKFQAAFGTYQDKSKKTPLGNAAIRIVEHGGDLWFATPDAEFRLTTESEKDGVLAVEGPPIRITFVTGDDGRVSALKILSGRGDVVFPRVEAK